MTLIANEGSLESISLKFLPQDSRHFSLSIFELSLDFSSIMMPQFDNYLKVQLQNTGAEMVSVRIPVECSEARLKLQKIGFKFIDRTVDPQLSADAIPKINSSMTVDYCDLSDLDSISSAASQIFQHSRYHLDNFFPKELANTRMENWIRTSILNPEHKVVKILDENRETIAFFVSEKQGVNVKWLLNGMTLGNSQRGIGALAWASMINHEFHGGSTAIVTRISTANLAAINLYRKLNFSFTNVFDVFHLHVS